MKERLRFQHVSAQEIAPYVPALRRLEAAITYPIADGADRFRIDHGPSYHPFFSGLGEAHFVLALDGEGPDAVVGAMAGVLRSGRAGEVTIPSVYLGDLKLHRDYRGQGVIPRLMLFALGLTRQARFRRWRLAYGAAMRGERGDLMRSARGLHLLRLGSVMARLAIYFAPAALLARLHPESAPAPPRGGLDLSPDFEHRTLLPPGIESTAGRKDLRLVSTGEPWPLWHLPRSVQSPGWGAYLRECGQALHAHPGLACFAVDERLTEWTGWLARSGLTPGAVCTVYGLGLCRAAYGAPFVHLSTSEI